MCGVAEELIDFEKAAEAGSMVVGPTDDGGLFLGFGNRESEGVSYVVLDSPSVISLVQSMLSVLQGDQDLHVFKTADDAVRGGYLGGASA